MFGRLGPWDCWFNFQAWLYTSCLFLGGGFKYFLFSPLFGEDSNFDQYFSKGLKPPTSFVGVFFFPFITLKMASEGFPCKKKRGSFCGCCPWHGTVTRKIAVTLGRTMQRCNFASAQQLETKKSPGLCASCIVFRMTFRIMIIITRSHYMFFEITVFCLCSSAICCLFVCSFLGIPSFFLFNVNVHTNSGVNVEVSCLVSLFRCLLTQFGWLVPCFICTLVLVVVVVIAVVVMVQWTAFIRATHLRFGWRSPWAQGWPSSSLGNIENAVYLTVMAETNEPSKT